MTDLLIMKTFYYTVVLDFMIVCASYADIDPNLCEVSKNPLHLRHMTEKNFEKR